MLVGAESDESAVETHTVNLGGLGSRGRSGRCDRVSRAFEAWGIQSVDLVAGGAPCQAFSRAGQSRTQDLIRSARRTDDDPRAALWKSFMSVVETRKHGP